MYESGASGSRENAPVSSCSRIERKSVPDIGRSTFTAASKVSKSSREVSVSLDPNSLERRGHHRFRAPAHLLVQRLLIRQPAEARFAQELSIFNAAGKSGRPEDVSRGPAFIQLQELVAASPLWLGTPPGNVRRYRSAESR